MHEHPALLGDLVCASISDSQGTRARRGVVVVAKRRAISLSKNHDHDVLMYSSGCTAVDLSNSNKSTKSRVVCFINSIR